MESKRKNKEKRSFRVGVDDDGVLGDPIRPTLSRLQEKGKGVDLERSDMAAWYTIIIDTNISAEIEKNLLDPAGG